MSYLTCRMSLGSVGALEPWKGSDSVSCLLPNPHRDKVGMWTQGTQVTQCAVLRWTSAPWTESTSIRLLDWKWNWNRPFSLVTKVSAPLYEVPSRRSRPISSSLHIPLFCPNIDAVQHPNAQTPVDGIRPVIELLANVLWLFYHRIVRQGQLFQKRQWCQVR